MKEKLKNFMNNAKLLNDNLNIIPLLYGSLGLEVVAASNLNADDIDILIPTLYVKGPKWEEFKAFLESNGYVLIDSKEHTFRKDNIDYSYSCLEELESFVDILVKDIRVINDDVSYLLLSLEQYLKVYEKSALDGYRMNKKEKKDLEKIKLIKSLLGRE